MHSGLWPTACCPSPLEELNSRLGQGRQLYPPGSSNLGLLPSEQGMYAPSPWHWVREGPWAQVQEFYSRPGDGAPSSTGCNEDACRTVATTTT